MQLWSYYLISFLRPGLEIDLKKEITTHLYSKGFSNAGVYVNGRDVTLMGSVSNLKEAQKAEKIVQEVWGINSIENNLLIKNQTTE